jgi:3-oxoadipate enol-lactonase
VLFFKIRGIVHHCKVEGSDDRPALVFSNCLGSDLRIWDSLVPYLVEHCRIIRYDKRGHGLSDVSAPPYSLDDLVQDLVGLLDALEIKEASLCGLSVGGLIAQGLALNYPERVSALVLSDTGMKIGSSTSWEERIALVRQSGLSKLAGPTMERWFTAAFREQRSAELRGYINILLRTPVEGYMGMCYALRDADLSHKTPNIRKPTLVLCGNQDVATPPELARERASAIPDARFSLVDQAAHLPCVEQPRAMARQMLQFFKEVHLV